MVVNGKHTVMVFHAALCSRASWHHLTHDRRHPGHTDADDAGKPFIGFLTGLDLVQGHDHHAFAGCGACSFGQCGAHFQRNVAPVERGLAQAPRQLLERHDRFPFIRRCIPPLQDFVAATQACLCRQALCERLRHNGVSLLHAVPCHGGIQSRSQQQVGHRPGRHNQKAFPYGLVVEGQMSLLRIDWAFMFVQHFHVPAQWQ